MEEEGEGRKLAEWRGREEHWCKVGLYGVPFFDNLTINLLLFFKEREETVSSTYV